MPNVIRCVCLIAVSCVSVPAWGFISFPELTLAEKLAGQDFAAVATMTSIKGTKQKLDADFRIECVLKSSSGQSVPCNLKVRTYKTLTPRRQYLVYGEINDGGLQENIAVGHIMNRRRIEYIQSLLQPTLDEVARLQFYLPFLANDDEVIAKDARSECGNIADVKPALLLKAAHCIPVERLRSAIVPGKGAPQNSLYGALLGLRGNAQDAAHLESVIYAESLPDFQLGLEGVISGYVLLRGEQGLRNIEQSHMGDTDRSFAQSYAAMMALRFLWRLESDRFDRERLKASMRLMLDHPAMPDLAIADLARWKDWTVMDRVAELTRTATEEHGTLRAVRVCACKYFDAAMVSSPEDSDADKLRIAQARTEYEALKKLDPESVKRYEKFFHRPTSN